MNRNLYILTIIFLFLTSMVCYSQIKILENKDNITLIGQINLENTKAFSFFPPKLKVDDGLTNVWNKDINKHFHVRKDANNTYSILKTHGTLFFGDLSSSIIYVKDKSKYLLTFMNMSHDYENESFWLSEKSLKELHEFIINKLDDRPKHKNYEILLENEVVLVLSFHKKKVSFNLYDHYKWYNSGWYKSKKIKKLFARD